MNDEEVRSPDSGEVVKGKEFTQALTSVFSQVRYIDGVGIVNPFNIDEEIVKANEGRKARYQKDLEFYQQAMEAREMMEKGFDKERYEENRQLINKLVRHTVGGGFLDSRHFNIEKEDALAQEVPDTEVEGYKVGLGEQDFIKLQDIPDGVHERTNVFDHERYASLTEEERNYLENRKLTVPGDEGYAYHRVYDDNGRLKEIRIFAQDHRDTLHVKTVSLEQVLKHLETILEPQQPGVISKPEELVSKDDFSKKIKNFNEQYGSLVMIGRYSNYDGQTMALIFPADLEEVENRLRELAPKFGLEVDNSHCINKGSWENRLGVLSVAEHTREEDGLNVYLQGTQYDLERDSQTHTAMTLDSSSVSQLAPLIQQYIESIEQG